MDKYIAYYKVKSRFGYENQIELQRKAILQYLKLHKGTITSEIIEYEDEYNNFELFKALEECTKTKSFLIVDTFLRINANIADIDPISEESTMIIIADLHGSEQTGIAFLLLSYQYLNSSATILQTGQWSAHTEKRIKNDYKEHLIATQIKSMIDIGATTELITKLFNITETRVNEILAQHSPS